MARVCLRGGFSDRNGIKPENKEIQMHSLDNRTRIQLQNLIRKLYADVYHYNLNQFQDDIQEFYIYIIGTVFSMPVDVRTEYYDSDVFKLIDRTFCSNDYDEVLSLIEGIINYWNDYLKNDSELNRMFLTINSGKSLYEIVNDCFQKEYVGYRFVNGIIVPISDVYEIEAVNEALNCKYQPIYEHISKANKHLADRINPDYENSIKESISAVEALCSIVTESSGKDATLGKMLDRLIDKNIAVHPALKQAFDKLYGYTSNANGIRHSGDIGGPNSTFAEAKFMLVACSAFINYVVALSAE